IRAVGPGVWTGWKGQLLRTLYFETEPLLGGGHLTLSRSERVARAQDALRERLAGWPKHDLERFIDRHYPSYWLRTDLAVVAEHARLIRDAEAQSRPIVTHIATHACSPWSPAPAPGPAPISSTPRSRPPATAWRSTPSISSASSTMPRTRS